MPRWVLVRKTCGHQERWVLVKKTCGAESAGSRQQVKRVRASLVTVFHTSSHGNDRRTASLLARLLACRDTTRKPEAAELERVGRRHAAGTQAAPPGARPGCSVPPTRCARPLWPARSQRAQRVPAPHLAKLDHVLVTRQPAVVQDLTLHILVHLPTGAAGAKERGKKAGRPCAVRAPAPPKTAGTVSRAPLRLDSLQLRAGRQTSRQANRQTSRQAGRQATNAPAGRVQ